MTHHIPGRVQDDMLFAVYNFDETHKVTALGNARDYSVATKNFWEALAAWGPYALVGSFNMHIDTTTGQVAIIFTPKD